MPFTPGSPSRQRHQYLQARKGIARRATRADSEHQHRQVRGDPAVRPDTPLPGQGYFWAGRSAAQNRGGKVSLTNHTEIDRNTGTPPISFFARTRALYGRALHSVCCCSKDSSTALAGSSFSFCFLYLLHLCKLANTFSIPHGYSS